MSRSRSLKDSSLDEAHERSIPPKLRIGLVCSPIGNSEDPFLLSILVESMAVAPGVGEAALALAAISPASRYPDDLMEISQNDAFELARASRLVFDWARDQCRPSQPAQ